MRVELVGMLDVVVGKVGLVAEVRNVVAVLLEDAPSGVLVWLEVVSALAAMVEATKARASSCETGAENKSGTSA